MPGGKHELCIRERRNEARTLKKETDMKRFLGLIIALLAGLTAIRAMSYEEARDRARFLTDKMAYELNLNEQQYNDAYEINLDYLMNIRTESDIAGVYLEHRNADFRCILYDWQYALFQAATYFFRPVLWREEARPLRRALNRHRRMPKNGWDAMTPVPVAPVKSIKTATEPCNRLLGYTSFLI